MSAAPPEESLFEIYAELSVASNISRQPVDEDWYAFTRRISVPGQMHEITADAYRFFLETSLPWLYGRERFCFADGDGLLRLFWVAADGYYCRQLTREESNRICDACGLPREHSVQLD